ncbi:ferredoxin:oxidoreductase FAD/NAD(P)-binding protein [Alcanivorax sp. S71-1-4]|uniref:CDP-6-deoxy-delta-3,4-glucoseen reductase n=1 Tax=Alcanivorax sp. S71-1-4 TaxID=1177159 RepID=UPI00135875BF|nr:CDP-6-deoxy-delta-3,4-glucoseen reductase [Alcanivorax sp. S71-1-4]KAF0805644.1 ferredoxin:oxidoreductase FAD/NAD(P)-binding protein [Alcanivorax sp. S71-1-4]
MKFHVAIEPSGQQYDLEDNKTILDGALAEGLMLRHSCREGTCGTCKGLVIAGEVDHGDSPEDVLSNDERAEGMALFCCARPRSDLVIHAPEVTELRGISIQQTPARVASIEKVSDDVAIVKMLLPPAHNFSYYPGQYVQVMLRDGGRRSYSMATSRLVDNQLQWHIRRMPDGHFSNHVFTALKPRDMLRLEGPYGAFYLRDNDRPMVFLASGTGMAPIRALLEQLREQGNNTRPVYLYWGGRRRQDLYLHEELLAWEAELSWLKYTPVLSGADEADAWPGRRGFVHLSVMEDISDLEAYEVYACGAPVVVDAARRDFVEKCRLIPDRFYADAFV